VVDMEGRRKHSGKGARVGVAAVKAISDDAAFVMPPLNRFIDGNGRFIRGASVLYSASPKWWTTLGKIRKNIRSLRRTSAGAGTSNGRQ